MSITISLDPKMTKETLLKELKKLALRGDVEVQHGRADWLLLEFIGDNKIKKVFESIKKWYG